MKPIKKARALLRSLPLEMAKGGIKGQKIRITNPKRYKQLKAIRGNRKKLIQEKRRLVELIKNSLHYKGIKPIKVFGRVKTLGSLDRKEKYAQKTYPKNAKEYLREDFLGVTIVVRSEKEAYSVLDAIKKLGSFRELGYRSNPRNYFKEPKKVSRPEVKVSEAITGNIKIQNSSVHIKIMTSQSHIEEKADRSKYKQRINSSIQRGKKN